jgi:pimeloyl-ACP methyl ester carboxylesterase
MKRLTMIIWACLMMECIHAQVPYGNNPAAGKYFNTGDANIYYEVYGAGPPVVLLHGGLYGYISDFEDIIPQLSKKYMVITIATRGHGKSELGHQPLSYQLFAADSYKVIRHVTADSVILIGFSDGADQGYYIAADHPEMVKKLVAIGGNFGSADYTGGGKQFIDALNAGYIEKNEQAFFAPRKKIMPDPARFDEFVNDMAGVWRGKVYVSKEKIAAIQCPSLIMAGENDGCPIEQYTTLFRLLKKGHLAIIPGSDHLVFLRQPKLMAEIIWSFIE